MPCPTRHTQVKDDDDSIALSNEKGATLGTAKTQEGKEENNLR